MYHLHHTVQSVAILVHNPPGMVLNNYPHDSSILHYHYTLTSASSGLLRVAISIQGIARKARLSISSSDTIHLCRSPSSGTVFLEAPCVFLREVPKLLSVQFVKPQDSGTADFKKTEILSYTPRLVQDLGMSQEMDPHWFLDALQHLGIVSQSPEDQPEYFIPAVLPQSSAIQDPPSSVASLCFTYIIKEGAVFSYSDMPRGVFCHLAVELIRQGWTIIPKESSRTLLKFCWKELMIFLKEGPVLIGLIPQVVENLPVRSAC